MTVYQYNNAEKINKFQKIGKNRLNRLIHTFIHVCMNVCMYVCTYIYYMYVCMYMCVRRYNMYNTCMLDSQKYLYSTNFESKN